MNKSPYVVTAIWEGIRHTRFYPRDLAEATVLLRWLARTEPESEPAIQIEEDFYRQLPPGEDFNPIAVSEQIVRHLATARNLSEQLRSYFSQQVNELEAKLKEFEQNK